METCLAISRQVVVRDHQSTTTFYIMNTHLIHFRDAVREMIIYECDIFQGNHFLGPRKHSLFICSLQHFGGSIMIGVDLNWFRNWCLEHPTMMK